MIWSALWTVFKAVAWKFALLFLLIYVARVYLKFAKGRK